jgi:predicted nucleotidyltransferase
MAAGDGKEPQALAKAILKEWAPRTKRELGVENIFAFGSVVRDGEGFGYIEGDVDLLVVWGKHHVSPEQRLDCANALAEAQIFLEKEFRSLIFNNPARKRPNCVNTELVSGIDITFNAYKGRIDRFFSNKFISICDETAGTENIRNEFSDPIRVRYSGLFDALSRCREFQAKYLMVNERGLFVHNDFSEKNWYGIPKSICRHARDARISSGCYGNKQIDDSADAVAGHADARVVLSWASKLWGGKLLKITDIVYEVSDIDSEITWSREDLFLMFEAIACFTETNLVAEVEHFHTSGRIETREHHMLQKFKDPPIIVHGFNTHCQMFPSADISDPIYKIGFQDSKEAFNQIETRWSAGRLTTSILSSAKEEIEREIEKEQNQALRKSYLDVLEVMQRGNSRYPRMTALPRLTTDISRGESSLEVSLSTGSYHLWLANERLPHLASLQKFKGEYCLNGLAVRVGYLYEENEKLYLEFQQRSMKNGTYRMAWDVAASGYLDPAKHADADDETGIRVGILEAARAELSEEMKIAPDKLPYEEMFYFFGVTRNLFTGQLDVLGYCIADHSRAKVCGKGMSDKVHLFEQCEMKVDKIIEFIKAREYWVPTAILTVMLILLHHNHLTRTGASDASILREFSSLEGRLRLGGHD